MDAFDKYIGQIIDGRYKLTKIIGSGGMSVVFEAVDLVMKRPVALKLLKDEISKDPHAIKRFINESKAISMLSHPNIVDIYDVSVKDNLKYLVMERVDGITLKSYINRKGALGYREALLYAQQILKALDHAHSKGIIHRDIKPQNIMLLKNGLIKVTDFGIAKLPDAETVTAPDKAIGTVYYISPEQAGGKPIDPRSDLYSLGVVMYEMLTGVLPFRADTPVSVALKQINEAPRKLRDYVPNIPVGVEQIVLTSMEKHPERRFQSASQMLKSVEQVLANPSTVFSSKKLSNTARQTGIRGFFGGIKSSDNYNKNYRQYQEEPEDTGKKKNSLLPVIIGVVSAVIIMAVVGGIFLIKSFLDDDKEAKHTITVENYVGQIYNDALKATMESNGYNIQIVEKNDDNIESGTIISQEPAEGSLRVIIDGQQKCDLTLTVSTGKKTEAIPDVKMLDRRNAEIQLKKIGAVVEYEYVSDEVVPENSVIKTEPASGEAITKGTTVKVYVSTGAEIKNTTIPDLKGKTAEEAKQLLEEYKLTLGEVSSKDSDAPKNQVIEQSHAVGMVVIAGTKINITLSTGTPETTAKKQVEVPNVVGKDLKTATEIIEALGLKWQKEDALGKIEQLGNISKTNPEAGKTVDVGTVITLYCVTGVEQSQTTAQTTTVIAQTETTKK